MKKFRVVGREEWLVARRKLLATEKRFTRARDRLSAQRRRMPWVRVDTRYVFDGPGGKRSLEDLFDGRRQLVVYHFMFEPSWKEGCPICSFWADSFDGTVAHLAARDVTLVAISRAPLKRLQAYQKRMGWSFPWFSSGKGTFNHDFNVTFTPQEMAVGEGVYNYRMAPAYAEDTPGISVFVLGHDGGVYHSYSTYGRGLDMMNAAYHYLDLTPVGRNEGGLEFPMAWVRRHDRYED